MLWDFVGGSAATLLRVPTDYVLLAAAYCSGVVVLRLMRMRRVAA